MRVINTQGKDTISGMIERKNDELFLISADARAILAMLVMTGCDTIAYCQDHLPFDSQ